MNHNGIVNRLSRIADSHSELVYAITMQNVLSEIVRRMGEDALELSVEELNQACEEVKDANNHNLDERDYIDMGLNAWGRNSPSGFCFLAASENEEVIHHEETTAVGCHISELRAFAPWRNMGRAIMPALCV
jgi:hypothetical protein